MAIIQDRRSAERNVEAKMGTWAEIEVWRRRREELIREAQERALAREARKVREAFAPVEERPGVPAGMTVRWGLAEDEAAVADLLQLNGMPRWVAFEERFIVAEKRGKLVGAVRYATESKRLSLGLLVVDPWAGERRGPGGRYTRAGGEGQDGSRAYGGWPRPSGGGGSSAGSAPRTARPSSRRRTHRRGTGRR